MSNIFAFIVNIILSVCALIIGVVLYCSLTSNKIPTGDFHWGYIVGVLVSHIFTSSILNEK